ncbi:Na /H antiporter, partial [Rhodanobacter sp. 115]
RGAITLAGVLTLPLVLGDGSAFPARDLAIFLATAVILISLVTASVGLPILLKGLEMPPETMAEQEESLARQQAATKAIAAVEKAQQALLKEAPATDADIYTHCGDARHRAIQAASGQHRRGRCRPGATAQVGCRRAHAAPGRSAGRAQRDLPHGAASADFR